jgi:hypothetical protein
MVGSNWYSLLNLAATNSRLSSKVGDYTDGNPPTDKRSDEPVEAADELADDPLDEHGDNPADCRLYRLAALLCLLAIIEPTGCSTDHLLY